jgi:hypothetical protein
MRITFAAAALGLAAALLTAGCQDKSNSGLGKDTGGKSGKSTKHTIVMEVTGTKTADVDYVAKTFNSAGDMVTAVPDTKAGGVAVPWSKTIELTTSGSVTLTANPPIDLDDMSATVSCRITVDGKEAAKDDNENAAALCTADIA